MERHWDVVVVGGGLAGLAAAATVAGTGASVLVLDAHRLGGRALTDEVDGYRFNRGAHALFKGAAGRGVLDRLGVAVRGASPIAAGSRVRRGDRVGALGLGAAGIARSRMLTTRDKAKVFRLLAGMSRWKPAKLADWSAAAWFDDLGLTDGARESAELIARTATYVADMSTVSADLVAVQVRLAVEKGVEYLHGGWVAIVNGLAAEARRRGAEIRTGATVRLVGPDGGPVPVGDTPHRLGPPLGRGGGGFAGPPSICAALLPEPPAAWAELGPPARA